jgi:hypothetical protein
VCGHDHLLGRPESTVAAQVGYADCLEEPDLRTPDPGCGRSKTSGGERSKPCLSS